ncbi:MAG: DUF3048 domain-containing protein [Candidatus Magasanikbacteria bacterium]|nr:DUF3048 domain-containing protein [Candidatus Magasanikbacteria bacterium]
MLKEKKVKDELSYVYALGLLIVSVSLCLLAYFLYQFYGNARFFPQDHNDTAPLSDTLEVQDCVHRRVLDGVCVATAYETEREVLAIMVENHFESWPQSGLDKARIVYEAPVEGNIPRFMALYLLDDEVHKVGPVRSARPYYLDWLLEYGRPLYMHVGGSPQALSRISETDIFDINEFYHGWYFWRSSDRLAPHNTYTSSKLWKKAFDQYAKDQKEFTSSSWHYSETESCAVNCAGSIEINFGSPVYTVEWKYNTSTGKYERFQMKEPHLNQDGSVMSADTVIVQRVNTKTIDAIGRKEMDTIGAGSAMIFRDGYVVEGRWIKESLESKTSWVDADGQDIALKAGKIWIEVLNQISVLDYSSDSGVWN